MTDFTDVLIENSEFKTGSGNRGGAISANEGLRLQIIDTVFEDTTSSSQGGAIYLSRCDELVWISGSTFSRCNACTAGGAIYAEESIFSLTNSVFMENEIADCPDDSDEVD